MIHFAVNANIHREADHDLSFIPLTKLPAVINTRSIISLHITSMVDTMLLNFLQIIHYLSKEEFTISVCRQEGTLRSKGNSACRQEPVCEATHRSETSKRTLRNVRKHRNGENILKWVADKIKVVNQGLPLILEEIAAAVFTIYFNVSNYHFTHRVYRQSYV
jgi:hypothetical protein